MNTYPGETEKAWRNAPQGAVSNWPGPQPARLPHLPLQVDDLKAKLAVQEAELKQKNENADKLIHVVGVETEKAMDFSRPWNSPGQNTGKNTAFPFSR